MYCGKCGAKIESNSAFCGKCGSPVSRAHNQSDEKEHQNRQDIKPQYHADDNKFISNRDSTNKYILLIILIISLTVIAGIIIVFLIRNSSSELYTDTYPTVKTDISNNKNTVSGSSYSLPTSTPVPIPTPIPTVNNQANQNPNYIQPNTNPSGDYLFNSDKQYITNEYLDTQTQEQVRLILNEMYAWHGYIFKIEEYSSYFSKKAWYTPVYTSEFEAESHFNDIERQNKITIVNYEKSKGWR